MAWTVSTYLHTNAMDDDTSPKWRVALFELMRAVNEREEAIGAYTLTSFYKGDGTQASNLALVDLDGLVLTGQPTETNLERIRVFVTGSLGRFTTTVDGTTVWTKSSMETAIGSDLDASATRPLEARFWQAMQDALDRMIYAYTPLTPLVTDSGSTTSTADSGYATEQLAWDNRAEFVISTPTPGAGWGVIQWFSGFRSNVTEFTDLDFRLSPGTDPVTVLGTITDSFYEYTSTFEKSDIASLDFDISSDSISISSSGSSAAAATVTAGVALSKTCSVDTAEPSTVPFSGVTGFDPGRMVIQITSLKIYHDLSSILTDQA